MTLNITDNLTAGTTQRLVTTTNYVDRDVNLTVTLQNDTWGHLTTASEAGDSVTYPLEKTESQRVSLSLNCNPSISDTVTFRVQADDVGFEADLNRSVQINQKDCITDHFVWTTASGSELRSRSSSGTVYQYDATANVIGQHSTDLDNDGMSETPYVSANTNKLRLVDTDQETSSVLTDDVHNTPTRIWAGSWNGSGPAVFYTNSTDQEIYSVQSGENPVHVASVSSQGVIGAGDIDDDNEAELVFSGSSQQIKYLEQNGTSTNTEKDAGQGGGIGMGEPADFDSDGNERVPYVSGSNEVKLIDAAGNSKTIVSSSAAKTPVAPYDWDDDSQPEITFVNSTGDVKYVQNIPDSALSPGATEIKSTGYTADDDAGVA